MTITYRSLAVTVIVVLGIVAVAIFAIWPSLGVFRSAAAVGDRVLERFGVVSGAHTAALGPQQAHFTALDGNVRVKKVNSNTWVTADFSLPLDKGDVVQTGSEGMAKLFFPDGTSYSVKPDSLLVVEENSANQQQQTQVAVQVTNGTVDLSTGTYSPGSSSQVIVSGATATLGPESAAMVHNDPRADQHEILLRRGSGQVVRKEETVVLSEYEKLSFRSTEEKMVRTKEISPPTLILPANLMPVYVPPSGPAARFTVHFAWTPVTGSGKYRLRVSRNPYLSSTVVDRIIEDSDADVPELREGTYYWVVTSLDAAGRQSVESERSEFTIVPKGPDATVVPLELEPFIQHGHVIEVKGRTDPAARVMVNGREVPMIRPDGGFTFFTPPLPIGENLISVTAQNAKGGVKTQQKKVVIE
jgi:hypothetical protein